MPTTNITYRYISDTGNTNIRFVTSVNGSAFEVTEIIDNSIQPVGSYFDISVGESYSYNQFIGFSSLYGMNLDILYPDSFSELVRIKSGNSDIADPLALVNDSDLFLTDDSGTILSADA